MKNVETLLAAADYIESHPDEYGYGWDKCVAAHVARQAGKELVGSSVIVDDSTNAHVSEWSPNYLGLELHEYRELFIRLGGVNKDDVKAVAEFVRQYVHLRSR